MGRLILWSVLSALPTACIYVGTDVVSIKDVDSAEELETWVKTASDNTLGRILAANADKLNAYTALTFCFNKYGALTLIEDVLKKLPIDRDMALQNYMDLLGYTEMPDKGRVQQIVVFNVTQIDRIQGNTLAQWLETVYGHVNNENGKSLYELYSGIIKRWKERAPSLVYLNAQCSQALGWCGGADKANMKVDSNAALVGCVQGWMQLIGPGNVVGWLNGTYTRGDDVGNCRPTGAAWELRLLMFANGFFDVWTGDGYTGLNGQRGLKEYLHVSKPLDALTGVSFKFTPNP